MPHLHGHPLRSAWQRDRAFIAEQAPAFLRGVDLRGRVGINHRGGAAGFVRTLAPTLASPGSTIVLPDYAGNGAFEAIDNILEAGQALLLIPDYSARTCLAIQGHATVGEPVDPPPALAAACPGAARIVTAAVQRVTTQSVTIEQGAWPNGLTFASAHTELAETAAPWCAALCR